MAHYSLPVKFDLDKVSEILADEKKVEMNLLDKKEAMYLLESDFVENLDIKHILMYSFIISFVLLICFVLAFSWLFFKNIKYKFNKIIGWRKWVMKKNKKN